MFIVVIVSSSSNKESLEREKEHPFLKTRRDGLRDDENENNNEPFFIPIARTFTTVDDDRDEEDLRVLETFFEIDGDDRTTFALLKEEANMIDDIDVSLLLLRRFLCGVVCGVVRQKVKKSRFLVKNLKITLFQTHQLLLVSTKLSDLSLSSFGQKTVCLGFFVSSFFWVKKNSKNRKRGEFSLSN